MLLQRHDAHDASSERLKLKSDAEGTTREKRNALCSRCTVHSHTTHTVLNTWKAEAATSNELRLLHEVLNEVRVRVYAVENALTNRVE